MLMSNTKNNEKHDNICQYSQTMHIHDKNYLYIFKILIFVFRKKAFDKNDTLHGQ